MDLPHVDTCCFGILPLKTGSLICGVVSLVVELGMHGRNAYYQHDTIALLYQILLVCGIFGAVLLIVGVLMNRSSFAQLYIVAYALLIIFTVVMLIWYMVKYRTDTDLIISTVVYVCVVGYCLIVVNSYYKTMG